MKRRTLLLAALLLLLHAVSPVRAESPERELTVLVYLCGSNLESSYGSATEDMMEMRQACPDGSVCTVLAMAGGTSFWFSGYDPGSISIVEVNRNRVAETLDVADMGAAETLSTFLRFGMERFPARDYALVLWNHGGGPLEGVCWDELFSMDSLSLSELTEGLRQANLPKKLRWIGFDACLMGSAEVAAAVAPYAEYMIASQETEPAVGWNYSFLADIAGDASGADTGRRIVDAYFEGVGPTNDPLTMACVDLSRIGDLRSSMTDFFTHLSKELNSDTFAALSELRFASAGFGAAIRGVGENDYDLVDLGDLVSRCGGEEKAAAVLNAVSSAVVCCRTNVEGATGLSVYHPFSNKTKYLEKWKDEYDLLDFSSGYEAYLNRFGALLTGKQFAEWKQLQTQIPAGEQKPGLHTFSLQLTGEQQAAFSEAQLLILSAADYNSGVYATQTDQSLYSPVAVAEARLDASGLLTGTYPDRALYVTAADGTPLQGPLSYRLSEDGSLIYVRAFYQDESGREDHDQAGPSVIFICRPEADGSAEVIGVRAYDSATGTYTNRIPVREEEYTDLYFTGESRRMPEAADAGEELTGYDLWEEGNLPALKSVRLPMDWRLTFLDAQLSASQLYAAFQITDVQQSVYSSIPVPVPNPNLEDIEITPRSFGSDDYDVTAWLVRDSSPLDPGLNLVLEAFNHSRWPMSFILKDLLLNGRQTACPDHQSVYLADVAPGESRIATVHIPRSDLTGLQELSLLSGKLYLAYENHSNANLELPLRLETGHCVLEGIALPLPESLADAEDGEFAWHLRSLERNAYGEWTGLLQVDNRSDREQACTYNIAVNHLLIDSLDMPMVQLPARTTSFVPFTLSDRVRLQSDVTVRGRRGWYWLASDRYLEQYGVTKIASLSLIQALYDVKRTAELPLREPLPVDGGTGAGIPEALTVLTGDVQISVERALLADNGVGLRLRLENRTDEAHAVLISATAVSGIPFDQRYPVDCVVPANGTAIHCCFIPYGGDFLPEGMAAESLSLFFRMDAAYSSPVTQLRFRQPDENGSRYLEPAAIETNPVSLNRPEVRFPEEEILREGAFRLRLRSWFVNGKPGASAFAIENFLNRNEASYWVSVPAAAETNPSTAYMLPEETRLVLSAKLTNLSGQAQWYNFSAPLLNSFRMTQDSWLFGELAPGETKESRIILTANDLIGISSLGSLDFEASWYPPQDYRNRRDAALHVDAESSDLTGLFPSLPAPLAEGESEEVVWQLLSAAEQEDGQINLLLRAENTGDQPYESYRNILDAGDVCVCDLPPLSLAPGTDQLLAVSFSNFITVASHEVEVYRYPALIFPMADHVLERLGFRQLKQLAVFTGVNVFSGSVGGCCILNLAEPYPLADIPTLDLAETSELLNRPEMHVHADRVLIGDDGIAVAGYAVNYTGRAMEISYDEPSLNGVPCEITGKNRYIVVPPYSTTPIRICVRIPKDTDAFPVGTDICSLALDWHIGEDDTIRISAELKQDAPLGTEGGTVLPGSVLEVRGAAAETDE